MTETVPVFDMASETASKIDDPGVARNPGIFSGEDRDRSSLRTLLVAETIFSRGPLSLKELSDFLPFHRSSIWRSVNALKRKGWVRTCIANQKYIISARFHNLFENSDERYRYVEPMYPIAKEVVSCGLYHVDIGMFEGVGRFCVVESSRRSNMCEDMLSISDDILAIAAQLFMKPACIEQHAKAYLSFADPDERYVLQSSGHLKKIEGFRKHLAVWNKDRTEVALPVRKIAQRHCAIGISLKTPNRSGKRSLEILAKTLKPRLI